VFQREAATRAVRDGRSAAQTRDGLTFTAGYSGSGSTSRDSFPSRSGSVDRVPVVTHTAARQLRLLTGFPDTVGTDRSAR